MRKGRRVVGLVVVEGVVIEVACWFVEGGDILRLMLHI
jgi:hypothetical protein